MGKAQGPSVVSRAVVAFLLPPMVFIAALAAFERILSNLTPHQFPSYPTLLDFLTKNWCGAKQLQTVISFLLALTAASISILIIKAINRRLGKGK